MSCSLQEAHPIEEAARKLAAVSTCLSVHVATLGACCIGDILTPSLCTLPDLQAGAAAALLLAPCSSALASEFDILTEPKPTSNYVIDDANVLNRTTKKSVNDTLSRLEVRNGCMREVCLRACTRHAMTAAEDALVVHGGWTEARPGAWTGAL